MGQHGSLICSGSFKDLFKFESGDQGWHICCSSSTDFVDPEHVAPRAGVLTQWQRNKVRPLLCDLEADFHEFAGDDGKLDAGELAGIWKRCAERKVGELSQTDTDLIESTAASCLKAMDIDKNGSVTYEEFVSYMLGGLEKRGPLKDLRQKLEKQVEKDPTTLKHMVDMFKRWDKNGDGYITMEELESHLGELERIANQGSSDAASRAHEMLAKFKEEFKHADVDGDNKLDLWEVLAHCLGRRKTPVELLLYDISNGASKRLSPLLLGKNFEAIYHASVMVFGSEYWYGGKVFRSEAPCDKLFGPPLTASITQLAGSEYKPELRVVKIGCTLATVKEFNSFLESVLSKKYTPESYDVLTHNCLNFADEAVDFLTGMHLPDCVRCLADNVLKTPTARLLRPFLNKWLGGFGTSSDKKPDQTGGGLEDSRSGDVHEAAVSRICEEVLGQGKIVTYAGRDPDASPCVAVVTAEQGSEVAIRFFDPHSGEFHTEDHVDSGQLCARQL